MASERQIRANRENALHSTGPRTTEGKAAMRFNALKHGLLAEAALLPNEDPAELEKLRETLHADFEPVGELERQFVDRIVSCLWRLRRVIKVEAGLFVKELYSEIATRASAEAGRFCITEYPGLSAISDFVQSETRIIDAEKHGEAVERARAAREIAEGEASELGAAFMRDAAGPDAFSKLSRYEARIEKSLFQTLAALHTLQTERRRGQDLGVTPIGALPAVGDACAANDEAAA